MTEDGADVPVSTANPQTDTNSAVPACNSGNREGYILPCTSAAPTCKDGEMEPLACPTGTPEQYNSDTTAHEFCKPVNSSTGSELSSGDLSKTEIITAKSIGMKELSQTAESLHADTKGTAGLMLSSRTKTADAVLTKLDTFRHAEKTPTCDNFSQSISGKTGESTNCTQTDHLKPAAEVSTCNVPQYSTSRRVTRSQSQDHTTPHTTLPATNTHQSIGQHSEGETAESLSISPPQPHEQVISSAISSSSNTGSQCKGNESKFISPKLDVLPKYGKILFCSV